jgi:hypothetical protein
MSARCDAYEGNARKAILDAQSDKLSEKLASAVQTVHSMRRALRYRPI